MKRNGFTLIELLAVIVILAIIALIATPIVLNIINNAKTSSNERSGELYVKAVENAIMKKQMNGTDVVTSGDYTVQSDGSICIVSNNVCSDGTTISVDVEGDVPEVGSTLTIDTKGVVTAYTLVVSGTSVTKGTNSDNGSTIYEVYEDGDYVYFDIKTGTKCSNYHIDNSKTGYNGEVDDNTRKTTDNQTSCLKFYTFNDSSESSTVDMILDHNTTATFYWNLSYDVTSGPNEILTQLKTDTENWIGVEIPKSYTNEFYEYTVDYTNYGNKARLITAQEIAEITGADEEINWDETTAASFDDWYILDSKEQDYDKLEKELGTSTYAWLFDYTGSIDFNSKTQKIEGFEYCTSYGCSTADTSTQGYWTASAFVEDHGFVWMVFYFGVITPGCIENEGIGIRPVITVEKSKLN